MRDGASDEGAHFAYSSRASCGLLSCGSVSTRSVTRPRSKLTSLKLWSSGTEHRSTGRVVVRTDSIAVVANTGVSR